MTKWKWSIMIVIIIIISSLNVLVYNVTAADTTPPRVSAKGQTGVDVSITSIIFSVFNEAMNISTLQPCFNITPYVPGAFSIASNMIQFRPYGNLQTSTTYNVTLNASIAMDLANNTLDGNANGVAEGSPIDDYSWEFTTEAADTDPPKVQLHVPLTASGVSVTTEIMVGFNEWMDETNTQNAFNLTPYAPGTFTFSTNPSMKSMTFTPNSALAFGTTYNVTLNGSIAQDLAGNLLDGNANGAAEGAPTDNYSWEFTTEAAFTEPPVVVKSLPTGASVPVSTNISITFNRSMNWTSVENAFVIAPSISGTFTPEFTGIDFNPDNNLSYGTIYTVTINSSVAKDNANLFLDGNNNTVAEGSPIDDYSWSFTTEPDFILPKVLLCSPSGSSVKITTNVSLSFNEAMNATSVQSAFNITPFINGTFVWNSTRNMTFAPVSPLLYNTQYKITVNSSIAKDLVGNLLDGNDNGTSEGYPTDDYSWSFTTVHESVSPKIVSHSPTGTTVVTSTKVSLSFNEPMNATSVQSAFNITPYVTGAFTWNSTKNMTFTPGSSLLYNTQYTITLNASIAEDAVGNLLDGNGNGTSEGSPKDDYIWSFMSVQAPDTTPPKIVTVTPTGTNVAITASITITFNELINKSSIEGSFSMISSVAGSFSWSGNNFTFKTSSNLTYNRSYTVTINGNIARDLVGNTLDGNSNGIAQGSPVDDYSWTFNTEPDIIPPAQIDDLTAVTGTTNGAIILSWTATGDDGNIGNASAYDIRYSLATITEANWQNATIVTGEPMPTAPGTAEHMTVTGLQPEETYYFAIKVFDEVPNPSILSNVVNAVAKDLTGPVAPTGLIAIVLEEDRIQIQWNAVADSDLHHYLIYRSTDNVTFEGIANINAGTTSYMDLDVVEGTTYYYKLTALDDEYNESPFSATVKVTLTSPIVDTPSDYTIFIIVLVIVIVGALGALWFLKKGRKPEIQQEIMDVEPTKATDEAEADTGK